MPASGHLGSLSQRNGKANACQRHHDRPNEDQAQQLSRNSPGANNFMSSGSLNFSMPCLRIVGPSSAGEDGADGCATDEPVDDICSKEDDERRCAGGSDVASGATSEPFAPAADMSKSLLLSLAASADACPLPLAPAAEDVERGCAGGKDALLRCLKANTLLSNFAFAFIGVVLAATLALRSCCFNGLSRSASFRAIAILRKYDCLRCSLVSLTSDRLSAS